MNRWSILYDTILDRVIHFFSVKNDRCRACAILEEALVIEREKRDYFERLLLVKSGIISTGEVASATEDDFVSIHRINTMSSLRRAAQGIILDREEDKKKHITPEEQKFEDALSGKDKVN